MATGPGSTLTAVFPLVERAKQFVAHVTNPDGTTKPGWHLTDVKRTGKTVTWTVGPDASSHHFSDLLETVGAFGSDQRRKATLNGVTAPMEW